MAALSDTNIQVQPRLQRINAKLSGTFLTVHPSSLSSGMLGVFLTQSTFPLCRPVYQESPLFYWPVPGRCENCLEPVQSSCCDLSYCSLKCYAAMSNKHKLVCGRNPVARAHGCKGTEESAFQRAAANILDFPSKKMCKRGLFDALVFILERVAICLSETKNEANAVVRGLFELGEICPSQLQQEQLSDDELDTIYNIFGNLSFVMNLLQPDFSYVSRFDTLQQMLFGNDMLAWIQSVVLQTKIPIKKGEQIVGHGVYNIAGIINYSRQVTAHFTFSGTLLSVMSKVEEGELFVAEAPESQQENKTETETDTRNESTGEDEKDQ